MKRFVPLFAAFALALAPALALATPTTIFSGIKTPTVANTDYSVTATGGCAAGNVAVASYASLNRFPGGAVWQGLTDSVGNTWTQKTVLLNSQYSLQIYVSTLTSTISAGTTFTTQQADTDGSSIAIDCLGPSTTQDGYTTQNTGTGAVTSGAPTTASGWAWFVVDCDNCTGFTYTSSPAATQLDHPVSGSWGQYTLYSATTNAAASITTTNVGGAVYQTVVQLAGTPAAGGGAPALLTLGVGE